MEIDAFDFYVKLLNIGFSEKQIDVLVARCCKAAMLRCCNVGMLKYAEVYLSLVQHLPRYFRVLSRDVLFK